MGNSSSNINAQTETNVNTGDINVESGPTQDKLQNERRIAHIFENEDDKGRVTCSCGMQLPSRHYYNLHVESWNHLPANNTGWPDRHFEGLGSLRRCQRGVVSKGDLEHAMFTVITLQKQRLLTEEVVRQAARGMYEFHNVIKSVRDDAESYVEKRDLDSVRLVGLVAASAELWPVLDPSGHPPSDLHAFTPLEDSHGKVRFPKVHTDFFVLVKSNHKDLCVAATDAVVGAFGSCVASAESFPGFRFKKGRDLTGFIDGTRNPDHLLRALADEALVFAGDQRHGEGTASVHEGGSYMWAGRFVHDLAKFRSLLLQCKSAIIGRQYDKVSPHVGYDRRLENPHMHQLPGDSHVSRGHGPMYRQAYPYVAGSEKGLYFSCYSRKLEHIDTALRRMAGKREGSPDRLLSITQAVTGNYYYVPSMHELQALRLWFRPVPQTVLDSTTAPTTTATTVESAPAITNITSDDNVDVPPDLPVPAAAAATSAAESAPATAAITEATSTDTTATVATTASVDVGLEVVSFEARVAAASAFLARRALELSSTLDATHSTAAESKTESKTNAGDGAPLRIEIEYCTNCGYNSVFYNMKRVIEETGGAGMKVVPNPFFPRQSAFEVKVVGRGGRPDAVLWSKLSLPDGRNNYAHCFPTELQMSNALKEYLGVTVTAAEADTQAKQEAGAVRETIRNGVW